MEFQDTRLSTAETNLSGHIRVCIGFYFMSCSFPAHSPRLVYPESFVASILSLVRYPKSRCPSQLSLLTVPTPTPRPFPGRFSLPDPSLTCCLQSVVFAYAHLTRFNKIAISNNKFQMESGQGSHWLIESPTIFSSICSPPLSDICQLYF